MRIRLILFAFLVLIAGSISVSAVEDLINLQAKVTSSGALVDNGNVTVEIWNAATGGDLIYNSSENFAGNVSNGFFNVILGSVTEMELNFSQIYYMDIAINGEDLDWGADERRMFQSPVGNEIAKNFTVDPGDDTFFVDVGNNRVGIGTTYPAQTLHLYNSSDSGNVLIKTENSDVGWIFGTRGDTGDAFIIRESGVADRFTIQNGTGNVGIGTTSPIHKIHSYLNDTAQTHLLLEQAGTGDTSLRFLLTGVSEWILGTDNSDGDKFKIANSGGLGTTDRLTIDTSGRVGIGTTGPSKTLDVIGEIKTSRSTATVGGTLTLGNGGYDWEIIGNQWEAGDLMIRNPANEDVMYFSQTGGNVGIGTTSPSSLLDIKGNTAGTVFLLTLNNTGDSGEFIQMINDLGNKVIGLNQQLSGDAALVLSNSSGDTTIQIQTGSGQVSYFNAGNIGIGTTSPQAALDVSNGLHVRGGPSYASSDSAIEILRINEALGTISMINGSDRSEEELRFYGTPITFYQGGGEKMRVHTNGNVGIGTTSPGSLLHLYGSTPFLSFTDIDGAADVNDRLIIRAANSNDALLFQSYDDAPTPTTKDLMAVLSSGNVGIGVTDPDARLEVVSSGTEEILYLSGGDGNCVDSAGEATCNINDIAENIFTDGNYSSGTVVIVSPDNNEHVRISTQPYDTRVAGIISTTPALRITTSDGAVVPLALAGRVKVKVSTENGIINRGDLLTTSLTQGHAMKCEVRELEDGWSYGQAYPVMQENERCKNSILGKALEPCYSSTCKIIALITLQ